MYTYIFYIQIHTKKFLLFQGLSGFVWFVYLFQVVRYNSMKHRKTDMTCKASKTALVINAVIYC